MATKPTTKAATVERLLRRARGATQEELEKATGWKPHSVRAFLSGLRKKGNQIEREERSSGAVAYIIRMKKEEAATIQASDAAQTAPAAAGEPQ